MSCRKIVLLRIAALPILFLYAAIAIGQTKRISLNLTHVPLKDALEIIQKKGNINLLYSNEIVQDSMMVTARFLNVPVSIILDSLLSEKGLFVSKRPSELMVIGSDSLRLQKGKEPKNAYTITGGIRDDQNQPISYASITLLKDQQHCLGIASDKQGNFSLTYQFEQDSVYTVLFSSINYRPDSIHFVFPDTTNIKNIMLRTDKTLLSEVLVKSKKPPIERLSDRYILNVDGTSLEQEGDLFDVLRNAPGVWIDANGTIHLSDNQPVKVMINGIVQQMTGTDLAYFLRGLKSSDIKKIEIIPVPPAEFEASASGGLINIVLKKSSDNGVKGHFSGLYEQQKNRPYYSPSGMLNYKSGKWLLFGRASYIHDKSDYIATSTVQFSDTATRSGFTNRFNRNHFQNYAMGIIYDISPDQSLGIQGTWNNKGLDQNFITSQSNWSINDSLIGVAVANRENKTNYSASTLNYTIKLDTLGSEFKIIGDYVNNRSDDNNGYTSSYDRPELNTIYRNMSSNKTRIFSGQGDLSKMLSSGYHWGLGVKLVSTNRDNQLITQRNIDTEWKIDSTASNQYIYEENILMGYASAEKKYKNLIVKGGVRLENTVVNGNSVTLRNQFRKSYLNVFPSLFITRTFNKNALSFNYSRKIRRPGFQSLNPFRIFFNDYSVLTGNPDLKPVIYDAFRLEYLLNNKYTLTLSYNNADHIISNLAVADSNNIIVEKPENFNKLLSYSAILYAPVDLFKWWKITAYLSGNYQRYELPNIKVSKTSFMTNIYNRFTFNNNINASLNLSYRTPYIEGNTKWANLFTSRATVSKSFQDEKFNITLFADDLFNSFREKYTQDYQSMHIDFYQKRPTQTFGIYFTYNFSSGKKLKEKKLEQSNIDEKNRL